ncbi:MAG: HK97 gp10 family phage protein [Candidatus Bathyarchaeia archaeon]
MALAVTFEVGGVEELAEKLNRLDEALFKHVHQQLLRWALILRETARGYAPVRTGYLRSSIYATVHDWVVQVGAKASYAMFVEFGTRYMRAKPYLAPALQQCLPGLERMIVEAIEQAKAEVEG